MTTSTHNSETTTTRRTTLGSAARNLFTATKVVVATSAQLVVDSTDLIARAAIATPAVGSALLHTPFDATQGYLEEDGMSADEAHAQAYKYLDQPVADTVREASKATGSLLNKGFTTLGKEFAE